MSSSNYLAFVQPPTIPPYLFHCRLFLDNVLKYAFEHDWKMAQLCMTKVGLSLIANTKEGSRPRFFKPVSALVLIFTFGPWRNEPR